MSNFNQIFSNNASVSSFGNGQIFLKTPLMLNVAKFEESNKEQQDIQRNKNPIVSVGSNEQTSFKIETLNKASGDNFMFRRKTECLSIGTVYGVSSKVHAETPQHGHFGQNKKFLTNEGLPNETAIIKKMRDLGVHYDVREARFGQMYNTIFSRDYYDNATALFAKLILHYNMHNIISKMDETVVTLTWDKKVVSTITKSNVLQENLDTLKSFLTVGVCAMGFYEKDQNLQDIVQTMKDWAKTDTKAPNMQTRHLVWSMYSYDDGHSKSGPTFGSEFGFRNGIFLKPKDISITNDGAELIFHQTGSNWYLDDRTVQAHEKYLGYLNLSGFTTDEISVLAHIITDQDRKTPFLCDQSIPLIHTGGKILVVTPDEIENAQTEITPTIILKVIQKLVINHRYHEDFLAAHKATRYWIAQPATETVESHWWCTTQRVLNLPKFGIKRAVLHFLLEDEGVCLTKESIQKVRELLTTGDGMALNSLYYNTCWYWGEYLTMVNKKNFDDVLNSVISANGDLVVDEVKRADVMVSALAGASVDTPVYTACYTVWRKNIAVQTKRRVCFGKIDFRHLSNYNYKLNDNTVTLNSLVTPSCVALVTGLAGSLILNTPYGSMFNMNSAVRKREGVKTMDALNYSDLWAYGVVSRFQGFDVKYSFPGTKDKHVAFAANDVHIAMPPVVSSNISRLESYTVHRTKEREISFGSDTQVFLRAKTTFYWNRQTPQVLRKPKWSSRPADTDIERAVVMRHFDITTDDEKKYTVALMANYDIELSDFHVAQLTAAVPLPNQEGGLLLDTELITREDDT